MLEEKRSLMYRRYIGVTEKKKRKERTKRKFCTKKSMSKWKRKIIKSFWCEGDDVIQYQYMNVIIEKIRAYYTYTVWCIYDYDNKEVEYIGRFATLKEAKAFAEEWMVDNL